MKEALALAIEEHRISCVALAVRATGPIQGPDDTLEKLAAADAELEAAIMALVFQENEAVAQALEDVPFGTEEVVALVRARWDELAHSEGVERGNETLRNRETLNGNPAGSASRGAVETL